MITLIRLLHAAKPEEPRNKTARVQTNFSDDPCHKCNVQLFGHLLMLGVA